MRLRGTRALALSQGLSSCPARPKSATGHGARLTVAAMNRYARASANGLLIHIDVPCTVRCARSSGWSDRPADRRSLGGGRSS